MKVLVLGYGNVSRCDDGVGWFVAEELQKCSLPGVEVQTVHQLDIDLAETIQDFDVVIFVDAAVLQTPHAVTRTDVTPDLQSNAIVHSLRPSDLLGLAISLFGRSPRGLLVSIRGCNFDFGMKLSAPTEEAARIVVGEITELAGLLQRNATEAGNLWMKSSSSMR